MFIFTLLGLELFANKARFKPETGLIDMENGVPPEQNFDNFLNSFSLVFITLTNDGALVTYEMYTLAAGQAIATVFFVVLAIVGQKILLNLFIAILLENFDESALKQKMFEYEEE